MHTSALMLLRAFELAQSGRLATTSQVPWKLRVKGFGHGVLKEHFDSLATRHAIGLILKTRFKRPPSLGWIAK